MSGGTASAALAVAAADNNDGDPMAKVDAADPAQIIAQVLDHLSLMPSTCKAIFYCSRAASRRTRRTQVMPLHYIIQREMVDRGLHTGKLSHYQVDTDDDSAAARRRAARRLVARDQRHKPKGVAAMLADAEKASLPLG